MNVRTAWQALALPPSVFLTSAWPWRCLLYLASGVVVGAVTLVSLIALALGGIVLLITLIGIPLLGACLFSGIVVARIERWRLHLVDEYGSADPHQPPPRPGWWQWINTRIREQATWRELAYTIASLGALWWIDAGVIGLSVGIPVLIMSALPAASPEAGIWYQILCVGVGLTLLPLAVYPVAAWAGARAALARAVLSPRDTELGQQLTEVVRSRARLVDAFDAERQRIERDLHDGAQQRLVAVSMALGLAKVDVSPNSDTYQRIDQAQQQAQLALAELRELVRGVHPKVLSDRGLAAAVADVAGRNPIPTTTDFSLPDRLTPAVESTAYFVVTEALTNTARHSGATQAFVRGSITDDTLVIEVSDDGRGGADPTAGSGLAGLADRIAVLDGRLLLSSPTGGPTVVRVEIPCIPPAASE